VDIYGYGGDDDYRLFVLADVVYGLPKMNKFLLQRFKLHLGFSLIHPQFIGRKPLFHDFPLPLMLFQAAETLE
jgi:hypothetical protein